MAGVGIGGVWLATLVANDVYHIHWILSLFFRLREVVE